MPVRLVANPLDGVPNAPPAIINDPTLPVFTPRAVITPVPVVIVDGATPAPPPCTKALADSAADVAQVDGCAVRAGQAGEGEVGRIVRAGGACRCGCRDWSA